MTPTDHNSRCSGRTKSGKPCRAAATEGGLCFFHANPKKAAELGRIGGRKNGRVPAGSDPLPDLESVTALRDTVKRLISDVYAGKLHPRTAAGLAPLLTLQLRVIEKTDFEQRVAKLEKQLNKLKDQLQDPRVKAWREAEQQKRNDEALGKRPVQAVKPCGSNDAKTLDQS
jgi:hypothetical protein